MLDLAKLLQLLSTQKVKYTNKNVKLSVKKDGKFESGREKLKVTISDNKGKQIYESYGCETDDKRLLIDEGALYEIEYTIAE